jgi:hypothetical protein
VRPVLARADGQQSETVTRRGGRPRLARALRGLVPGWAFAAITVAPALVVVAWLVPGTGMLLAGRLRGVPMVIIFIPLAVALFDFAMGRLPARWPRFNAAGFNAAGFNEAGPDAAPVAARRKADVSGVALLAMLVIAAGFGVWQAVYRSEQVFVTSDPGVYLQYGYWIAQHGTVRIPESAAAFGSTGSASIALGGTGLGTQALGFTTPGFAAAGGSITPAFLPGLPLVLAGGMWLYGLNGALLMPAVLGGAAVLSFAGLLGRLCGAWWAVAGELVLAVSLPEVYTSRTPFSEPLVQVLLFGGLCLFIDSLVLRRRLLAGLGGFALGLTVLASVASLLILLPAFPVLAALFVAKRPEAGPFGVGLALGMGTGLATGLVLARAYLSTVSGQLHLIGLCAFDCCALTALVLTLGIPPVRTWLRRVFAYRQRVIGLRGEVSRLPSLGDLAQWLALVLPVLVLVGLAERPYFQVVRGQTDPAMVRAVAALQRLEGLPVDGLRQYYESSLHWVLWYLGAPTLLLACAGAAALGRRQVEAGLTEGPHVAADSASDSGPAADSASVDVPDADAGADAAPGRDAAPAADVAGPASAVWLWGLPFLIVAWSVVTVLWDPAVVPWQPLASHRLVPVVLPGLVLLAVWLASWLTARAAAFGASRLALAVVGTCCVLALAGPPVATTLNPGLAHKSASSASSSSSVSASVSEFARRVQLRGVGASTTYHGSIAAASALCGAIGSSASVLITDTSTAATFGPVIRDMCGQPAALVVAVPGAAPGTTLDQAVRSVQQAGRHPVLLGASRSAVALPGAVPRLVVSLRTAGDAQSLRGAPTGTWPVSYTAWLAVPATGGT